MRGRTTARSPLPAERIESAERFRERFLQMWDGMTAFHPATQEPDVPREDTQAASPYLMPKAEDATEASDVLIPPCDGEVTTMRAMWHRKKLKMSCTG
ncbi:hypothetical protein BST61_g10222 [Cercospora zeina]